MTDNKLTQVDTTLTKENIELENIYASFKPSWDPMWGYRFGSKNRSRMLEFCGAYTINNKVIDAYMSIPPARQDYETKRNYKDRMVLQKDLYRFRGEIYDQTLNVSDATMKRAAKRLAKGVVAQDKPTGNEV